MKTGIRVCDMDFKPTYRQRNRRRRQWIMGGVAGLTTTAFIALSLLGSTGDSASTVREPSQPLADTGRGARLQLPLALPEASPGARPGATSTVANAASMSLDLVRPNELADPLSTATLFGQHGASSEVQRDNALSAKSQSEPGWQTLKVHSGDNLATLFKRASLGAGDVYEAINAGKAAAALTEIYPGERVKLRLTSDGALKELRYAISQSKLLHLSRDQDQLKAEVEKRPSKRRYAHASGIIDSSLFLAGARAGLSARLIMELVDIFAWDVDFALDIRNGDRFTVVFEELYRNGKKVRNGNIVAAEFVNGGERYRAIRYEAPNGDVGYYTPQGKSMRKAFLRTPVEYTRITSGFAPNRKHPILGTKRPHMGTDYAAPRGTPIRAAGAGKIIHRGRKGGYGNAIVIRHGQRYTTLYGHMRNFRDGQHVGTHVEQGEIIGYVGSTGLSTGPHLHYEFRVNGTHRNPRTVDLPDADPVPERYTADFKTTINPMVAKLDALDTAQLASASTE